VQARTPRHKHTDAAASNAGALSALDLDAHVNAWNDILLNELGEKRPRSMAIGATKNQVDMGKNRRVHLHDGCPNGSDTDIWIYLGNPFGYDFDLWPTQVRERSADEPGQIRFFNQVRVDQNKIANAQVSELLRNM
jgi:hypothetical protein